ncbi:MAG: T9SS type A sorting domain-containing protein [Bacteroidales bacterium]|nr:T9SS type A sorting domain-containing protein [Bacteroidales bacterium]
MKKIWTLAFIIFLINALSAQTPQFTILSSNQQEAVVKVSFPDYDGELICDQNICQQRLRMPGAYPILNAGDPELLETAVSLIIPENSHPTVEVLSSQSHIEENVNLVPSKGRLLRNVDPATVPFVRSMSYQIDKMLYEDTVVVGEPYQLRDYHGVALQFFPFAYNPVQRELKVYSEMTVRVKFNSTGNIPQVHKVASAFHEIYQDHFLNYNQVKSTPLEEYGEILILAPDNFCDAMQPYAEWKIKNGYPTEIVPLSVAGSTSSAIKSYITSYYNSHNLAYVVIVGDNQQFPTISAGGNVSDNYYVEVAGNDKYPDVILGKISAETVAQVTTQVNKFIQYERNPVVTSHFPKFVGIASNQGPGDNNEYDYQHIRNIDNTLQSYTYTSGYEFFEGSQGGLDASGDPTAAMVSNALNSGAGIINYTGHGDVTMWVSSNFTNSHVNNLTNDNMLPFIFSVACVNGSYSGTTCFAEAWLRATHNGQPSGAVGTLMSTINQPWNSPMCAQDHMIQILTSTSTSVSQKRTFGGIAFNGLIKMLDDYNDYEVTRTWILFGDPALMVRTTVPQTLTVNYDNLIPLGTTSVDFTCPVEGARITLTSHNEILATGLVSNGSLSLNIPSSLTPNDSIIMLAAAPNYLPTEGVIQLFVQNGPYILCKDISFSDNGNNNGEADYGETVAANATFSNVGNESAQNISVTVTSNDPYLTILNGSHNISSMAANATEIRNNTFSFRVASNVPAFHNANVHMVIHFGDKSVEKDFVIPLHAPQLNILENITINDASLGNGNHRLDFGEHSHISLEVMNTGNGTAGEGTLYLNSTDGKLTVYRLPNDIPSLSANQSHSSIYRIKVNPSVTQSCVAELRALYRVGDYEVERMMYVKIGIVTEDWESGDFSSFSWNPGGNNNWTLTTQNPYEGTYAVRSATIGNNASSTLSISWECSTADTISFYYWVSSEEGYDKLSFKIDNSEKGSWSGNIGWTRAAFPVSAGHHTFSWTYSKDQYMTAGSDMAKIDYVVFPPSNNPTSVEEFVSTTSVTVMPNPTTDNIRIVLQEDANIGSLHYELYDLSGRMLQQDMLNDYSTTISLNHYANGMYFLVVRDAQQVIHNTKVIKQ